jgi:hypothetical protein
MSDVPRLLNAVEQGDPTCAKDETAAALLGISEPTAKRWWTYARAWLFEEMKSAR